MNRKSSILIGAVILASLVFAATSEKTIPAGTLVQVRTNQTIDSTSSAPGHVFMSLVVHNVTDRTGQVVIPGGSSAELVVKNVSKHNVALDLQAIVIDCRRYQVLPDSATVHGTKKSGLGANKRTGGGAIGGSVIGAIAGGGAGAAIGALAGGAAGATAQVLTKGKSVRVPAESLITFRLTSFPHVESRVADKL